MGSVISIIRNAYKLAAAAIKALLALNADYQEMLSRAAQPPGLPAPNPTASYWLADPPFPELVDARSEKLPEFADAAIIGSGITAAAVARALLLESQRKELPLAKVVVLEARQLTSGATGRNGGHIKPTSYSDFALLQSRFGADAAAAIVRFQRQHLTRIPDLCAAEHFDIAECRNVETVDLFLDDASFEKCSKQVEALGRAVPEAEHTISDSKQAQEKYRVGDHVVGAISYPAGALWPYRLVSSVWNSLLTQFPAILSIETGTPVHSIESAESDSHPFLLNTARGIVRARHVVHATNAFASELVPGLRNKMTGLRAHMSARRPAQSFPSDPNGERSWGFMYGSGFDYMTQRPAAAPNPDDAASAARQRGPQTGGDLMLGGGFFRSLKQGLDQMGVWDDSKLDALTASHLNGILPAVFGPAADDDHDDDDAAAAAGRLKQMWSGTICFTADSVPFVGRIDPRLTGRQAKEQSAPPPLPAPAEWIAAGYHGDGMIYAWLCGCAVGLMLAGDDDDDVPPERPGLPGGRVADWLPQQLRITYDRVQKLSLADLADEMD